MRVELHQGLSLGFVTQKKVCFCCYCPGMGGHFAGYLNKEWPIPELPAEVMAGVRMGAGTSTAAVEEETKRTSTAAVEEETKRSKRRGGATGEEPPGEEPPKRRTRRNRGA